MEPSQLPRLVCSWVSQGKVSGKQVYFKISFSICQIRRQMMVQGERIIITSQLPWLHINCWNQLQVLLHVFLQAFQKAFSFFSFHSAAFLVMSFVTDIITVSVIVTFLGNFFLWNILPVSFCLNDYSWLSNILILCYYLSSILIRLSCNSVKIIQNRALFQRY